MRRVKLIASTASGQLNRVNSMENAKKFRPGPKLRLMDQVRQVLRYHHYAYRSEQTYCDWIMRPATTSNYAILLINTKITTG